MANATVKNKITVIAFGVAAEKMKGSRFSVEDITDSTGLKVWLNKHFPELKDIKLSVAINKKIIHGETAIPDNAEVALLPPFSGG